MSCVSRFLNLQLNLKVNTETCEPNLILRRVYRFVHPTNYDNVCQIQIHFIP